MDTRLHSGVVAIVFAVLWTGAMVWWSGDYTAPNIIILAVCGILVGALWTWAMAWLQRRRAAGAKQ